MGMMAVIEWLPLAPRLLAIGVIVNIDTRRYSDMPLPVSYVVTHWSALSDGDVGR